MSEPSVKHQVFISSTYLDLREERSEVIQAVLELDCIPSGMESFVASNDEQWSYIRRVIDECDYYILIIGARYGSVTSEGLSYTEKEFHYARESGVPILAFVRGNIEEVPLGKAEIDPERLRSLKTFREKVLNERLVREFTSPQELGGLASRSLVKEIKTNPRPGWIRNGPGVVVNESSEIKKLRARIDDLLSRSEKFPTVVHRVDDLEQGSDPVTIFGSYKKSPKDSYFEERDTILWQTTSNWDAVFTKLAPSLVGEASEGEVAGLLTSFVHNSDNPPPTVRYDVSDIVVSRDTVNAVVVQMRALGLITKGTKTRLNSDNFRYWKLTDQGDRQLLESMARRRPSGERN